MAPKQPWLESLVLQCGWGVGSKTTKAGNLFFATRMGYVFQNSQSWKALFCNVDGVWVLKQQRLESIVLQRGFGTCSITVNAGKLCFTIWMGYVFQNSQGWKALFCDMVGVQVLKQPWLESFVFRRGWGTGSKIAKAGKLCFTMWMGYVFQDSQGWKTLFYNMDGVQNSQGQKALFCNVDEVRVPKQQRLESSVLQRGWGTCS